MSIDAVFAQFFDNIHDPRQHAKIYWVFGKECVQILGVGIESSCCDSDFSEHKGADNGIRKLSS